VVGPLCMHVLTFLCRESAAATFLLPGYQHDHIIHSTFSSQPVTRQPLRAAVTKGSCKRVVTATGSHHPLSMHKGMCACYTSAIFIPVWSRQTNQDDCNQTDLSKPWRAACMASTRRWGPVLAGTLSMITWCTGISWQDQN